MERVELTIALTLLFSFGAFLFFPTVDAPPIFSRVAITLCAAEFVAVVFWAAGDECIVAGCEEAAQTARTAASVDIPALTALMLVLATGLRAAGRPHLVPVPGCRSWSRARAGKSGQQRSTT